MNRLMLELNPDLAGASVERACEMADSLHRLCESHGDPEVIKAAFDLSYVLEYLRLNPQVQEDRERLMGTLDAERGLAGLREFVGDEADEDCHYGDNCPSNAGTRHGTCRSCKARQVLSACGIHVWFERDNLEACRNCGVVRRADDGNKPCKGEVKVTLRASTSLGEA
jgi:hypothetical protein